MHQTEIMKITWLCN